MMLSLSPELLQWYNLDGDGHELTSARYQWHFDKDIGRACLVVYRDPSWQ